MERNVPKRTADEVKRYMAQIREKLKPLGFKTVRNADGTLEVWKGVKYLGNVGRYGEFYCNSNDLVDPTWKAEIEKIMQAIEEVNRQLQQVPVEIPEPTVGEMTLE